MYNNYGGRYQSIQPIYTDENTTGLDSQGQNKARGGLMQQAQSPGGGLTGIGQSEVTTKNKGFLDGVVRAYIGGAIGGAAAGAAGAGASGVAAGTALGKGVATGNVKGGVLSGLLNTNASESLDSSAGSYTPTDTTLEAGAVPISSAAPGNVAANVGITNSASQPLPQSGINAGISQEVMDQNDAANFTFSDVPESLMRGAGRLLDMRGGVAGTALGGLMGYGADTFFGEDPSGYQPNAYKIYNNLFGN